MRTLKKQFLNRYVLYMEANSLKVEYRASLLLSHKTIFNISCLPRLVPGLLSSCIYGTYCTVYTVQCNVCTNKSRAKKINMVICIQIKTVNERARISLFSVSTYKN